MAIWDDLASKLAALIPKHRLGRRWVLINLVNSFGDALFISGNAVFATKVLGMTGGQVGLGISLAGVAGVLGAGVMGTLADRLGARRMLAVLAACQLVFNLLYTTATPFAVFAPLLCLMSWCKNGAYPASAALVAKIGSAEGRVTLRAQARSVYNVGFSLGAALAALALIVDMAPVYYALPVGNAASFLAVCLLVRGLPETHRTAGREKKVLGALRDPPFLATIALMSVLGTHASLLMIVIPLWIVERTTVPKAMIGILLVLNTIFAVAFQVTASKGSGSLAGGSRKARRAGLAIAAGCVMLAPSAAVPTLIAVGLMAVASLLLSIGEVLQSAGAWGMSYALAPQAAQAEYLGAFTMSLAGEAILAPAAGTALALRYGGVGWLGMGAVVLIAALTVGAVARRAQRSIHHRFPEDTEGRVHSCAEGTVPAARATG